MRGYKDDDIFEKIFCEDNDFEIKKQKEIEDKIANDKHWSYLENFDDHVVFHLKEKDPNLCGRSLFSKLDFTFYKGPTILIGCNGCGKTTLLDYLEDTLRRNRIKYLYWSDTEDGRDRSRSLAGFYENYELLATLMMSSEGENIFINFKTALKKIVNFVLKSESKNIYILIDGIDSGLSIDKIILLKSDFFQLIQESYPEKNFYIICTANTYELVENLDCIYTRTAKHMKFSNYEDYKKFILKSSQRKEKEEDNYYKRMEMRKKKEKIDF